jgi:hypothetical protein
MPKKTISREIEADQWTGDPNVLPDGCFVCQPEVRWSADRKLVYFTYAELQVRHWIDATERPMPPPEKFDFMCHGLSVRLQDGREYWRQVMPFMCWSVKSEASIKGDHRPVYLDRSDEALVRAFVDFIDVEKASGWTNPLPPRAEYRITDGGYGRGFRPVYLKPGDWLLKDPAFTDERSEMAVRAVSDEEFRRMSP